MALEIGSLTYRSTLDNSDFQAKSLEDIRLIKLRLELTGDTSGITKYDQAVKNALATEEKLRNDLNAILEEARIKTQELTAEIQKPVSKTVFSDSAAEVATYQAALEGLENGAGVVAGLNAQLDELVVEQERLIVALKDGTISEVEYSQAMDKINIEQIELVENIKRVNDAFSSNTVIEAENVAESAAVTQATQVQVNAYAELIETLAELKAARANPITPTEDLPVIARQIQETEAEITRFTNAGRVGFDEFGNAVENTTPRVGRFAAAVQRSTDIQSIGARIVSQFSRQIIGLGVGFLSLEIGAKAIQSLVSYIQNLDVFTGRLDQAKQNLLAFNEVMANADKAAGSGIANLRLLSDTVNDVSLSTDKRVAAAQKLKETFPEELANSTALQLVNGKLKNSYDELTESILKQAQAQSIITKVSDLASKEQDIEIQKQKIRIADANSITGNAANVRSAGSQNQGLSGKALDDYVKYTTQQFNADIALNEKNQFAELDKSKAVLESTYSFFIDFAKKQGLNLAGVIEGNSKLLSDPLKNFDKIVADGNKSDLTILQKSLQAKLDALTPSDSQFAILKQKLKEVDDLLKNYQVKASSGKTSVDPAVALLASQKKVLADIDALKDKYASKNKTRDEQEADAIKANFKKQYDEIVAQNVKVTNYLKTHTQAQATSKGLVKIDPNSILPVQTDALAGLAGQQSLEQTKQQIDTEKVIFQQYEDFKLKAGKDAADKLFGVQTKGFDSYIDYLKSLQPTEAELGSSDPYVKAKASALSDYLKKAIPEANDEELKLNQRHLQDLILQNQTYEQKRITLITNANDSIAKLNEAGDPEGAQAVQSKLEDDLTALGVQGLQTNERFKVLFQNITSLSRNAAISLVNDALSYEKAQLQAGLITQEAYDKNIKSLTALKQAQKDLTAEDFSNVGSELASIGSAFEGINEGMATYIKQLGSAFTSLSGIMKQSDKLQSDITAGTSTTGDYINLVGTSVTGVVNLIGQITTAAAERKKAEEDYYNSIIEFQNQYNLALDEQIRLQYQLDGNIFIENFSNELADAAKSYNDATKQYNQSLIDLQKGQAIVDQKNAVSGANVGKGALTGAATGAAIGAVVGAGVLSWATVGVGAVIGGIAGALGGLFGGKKKVNVLTPLLAQYPDLIEANGKFNTELAKTLVATNQVTDATKLLLNNTISYYEEQQKDIDQINSALSTLAGNLGSSLEDALVTAFENGTDAAKAFGDSVSDVISNIVSQFLFEDIFGDQFDKLNDKLKATVLAGGGSGDITADFVDFFKDAGPLVKEFEDALQGAKDAGTAQGLTLFPSGGGQSPNTLTGGIEASLTEDTAAIIGGTLKGIQLLLFGTNQSLGQMIMIAQDHLNISLAIEANTKRSADNSENLPDMLDELKGIGKNTSGSLDTQLRAAGFYKY